MVRSQCPYCGSNRVTVIGGPDGNPYNKNRPFKTVCPACGRVISGGEASLTVIRADTEYELRVKGNDEMDMNAEEYSREILENKALDGDADAMWRLSLLCEDEGDADGSADWFVKALDAGQTDALLYAAELCLNEELEIYSIDRAEMYLKQAADKGSVKAMLKLGRLALGDLEEGFMQAAVRLAQTEIANKTPLPEHQKQFAWYSLAAEAGDRDAMYSVAVAYHLGYPVQEDQTQAFAKLKRAVDGGDLMSMYLLAYLYENGLGTERDIDRAVELYKESGEKGVRGSLLRLYGIYHEGLGHIEPDPEKALRYLWMSGEGHT